MCRTLLAGLAAVAVASTAPAQPLPARPLPHPAIGMPHPAGGIRPVATTARLPTAQCRQFWVTAHACYRLAEPVVRYVTRDVFTPAVRLARVTVIDPPAAPDQWLDAALWVASPWLGKPTPDDPPAAVARARTAQRR